MALCPHIFLQKYMGGSQMDNIFEERATILANYIVENKATVRNAAGKYGISKSTVHSDITVRLRKINPALYSEVRKVLDLNKEERHIRGGIATREKYKRESELLKK